MSPMKSRALFLGLCAGLTLWVVSTTASAAPPPQIRYLDTDSASYGSFVGIYGVGFGAQQGSVLIGSKAVADYQEWTDTRILVRIPAGATTGLVQVQTKNGDTLTTAPNNLKIHTGNIYVVSVDTGNDQTGSGDETNPFKTVYHALSLVVAGDTILVREGVYDEQDPNNIPSPAVFVRSSMTGTTAKPITLRGWGKETPILRGSNDLTKDNPIVYLGGEYVRIARLKVEGTGNLSTAISAQGSNAWLAAVEVTDFTEQGVITGEGTGTTLVGNHIHQGGTTPGQSHGVVVTGSTGVVLDNEIDHLDNGYGLILQYQTEASTLVSNNFIHDTAGGGIGLFRVKGGNRIFNNVLWNTGASQGCQCALEVAYGAQAGETATLADRIYYNTFAGPGGFAVSLSDRSGTLELHGNIFADFQGGVEVADDPSKASLKSTHNLFFRSAGQMQFRWGAGFLDFAAYKTTSLQESASILGDPLLLDPTAGDFHLGASSPAIDQGGGPDQPDKDIEGVTRPQGVERDWGAYEAPPGEAGPPTEAGPETGGSGGSPPDSATPEADNKDAVSETKKDGTADAVPEATASDATEGGTTTPGGGGGDSDGGCGCSVPGKTPTPGMILLALLGAAALLRRRTQE